MTEDDRQRRIRERAHRIWIEEGRPEGRAQAHWDMASELIAQEENAGVATEPNPARRSARRSRRDEPVEPPEALENQGDFPGLRDQGEESPSPPRHKRRR